MQSDNESLKIFSHRLDGSQFGPHLLITAGVHGDEYEPMAAAHRMIKILDPNTISGTVTLVPLVNKPAFMRGARTGDDLLDLARTFPGKPDGTPTEQIADLISGTIRRADYFIDLHTGGNLFEISPLAGYGLAVSNKVLRKQRMMARAFNLPIVWGTSGEHDGRSLSIARDAGIPAIYVEYGGGGGAKEEIIQAYMTGCQNVMISLNMLKGSLPESKVSYFVEDNRKDSGYLQIMLPAPSEGYFEAEVNLGDIVGKGDRIGTLVDLAGGSPIPINADDNGMVFFLRRIPWSTKGETIGGILPIMEPGEVTIDR